MAPPLLAFSIDLDALDFYLGLYGLPQTLSEQAAAAIPGRAIERFGEICDALGIKGTLFVVGRDLALGRGHRELRAAATAGHEIASHSFAHDYGLSRKSREEIEADLVQAEQQIEAVIGQRPVGFRAPGYTVSQPLMEAIRQRGYQYDSSLLPSPPYYAAKTMVIGALAALGKKSHSILGHPEQLFRTRHPHEDPAGVFELPVTTLPGVRVPFIGTWLVWAPPALSQLAARTLQRDPLIVIELHGVDLCDASDGVPPELLTRQRELRIPATEKRRRIETVMRSLLQHREARTLAECAWALQRG